MNNVENTLIGNGATLASTGYIAYTNNLGWRIVKNIDLVLSATEVSFKEVIEKPIIWGTGDHIKYQGTNVTTIDPIELSGVTSCFSCCSGTTIPSTGTLSEDEIDGEYRLSIQFNGTVSCDVNRLTLDIVNTTAPAPSPLFN